MPLFLQGAASPFFALQSTYSFRPTGLHTIWPMTLFAIAAISPDHREYHRSVPLTSWCKSVLTESAAFSFSVSTFVVRLNDRLSRGCLLSFCSVQRIRQANKPHRQQDRLLHRDVGDHDPIVLIAAAMTTADPLAEKPRPGQSRLGLSQGSCIWRACS